MSYSGKEPGTTDFAFDQLLECSINNTAPLPSTYTSSSFGCSHGSLPYTSTAIIENRDLSVCLPIPGNDTMACPAIEELPDNPYFHNAFNMPSSQYTNRDDASYLDSKEGSNPYSQRIDLDKITEFEEWESPPAEAKVGSRDLSMGYPSSSFSALDLYNTRSSISPGHHSGLSLAASDSTKFFGRSEPSSPSEAPQVKRRQNSSGRPVLCLPTDTELELNLARASLDKSNSDKLNSRNSYTDNSNADRPNTDKSTDKSSQEVAISEPKPKSKASTKPSHLLIERKYRENLNSKIFLLDQILASTRQFKSETEGNDKKTPGMTRKGDVLNEAMRYVKQAEIESEARIKEIDFLRERVAALEKLVGCGDCNLLKQFAGSKISKAIEY